MELVEPVPQTSITWQSKKLTIECPNCANEVWLGDSEPNECSSCGATFEVEYKITAHIPKR